MGKGSLGQNEKFKPKWVPTGLATEGCPETREERWWIEKGLWTGRKVGAVMAPWLQCLDRAPRGVPQGG